MLSFLSCVSLLIPCQALGREKTFPADVHEPARKLLVLLHIGLDIEKISLFFPVGREKCGLPSGAGGCRNHAGLGPIAPFIAETGGQNAMIVDASPLAEQVVTDVLDLYLRQHRTLWRRRPLRHRPQSRRPPLPAPLRHRAHPLDRHHRCRRQGKPPVVAGRELASGCFGQRRG
jgi:hypothetical protein